MSIPSHILEAISKGECTLFFGAGASRPTGTPSGDELSELITDKFLATENWKSNPKGAVSLAADWGLGLASAASMACAQPGLNRGNIVDFVIAHLSEFKPSPAHSKIPWFRWRAIITTNYDQLIEKSYENKDRAAQKLVPVLTEEGLSKIGSTGSDTVPLLKPHGCISRRSSLSLSLEDIYQAKQQRRLLFTFIEVLHMLGPVIYIGYSFRDSHVLDMIYDLTTRLGQYRQPILFVTLQSDLVRAEKERNWIQGPIKGVYLETGFDLFMDTLCKETTPTIVPSMIIGQMKPCTTMLFASDGLVSERACYRLGEWEYWLTYSINHLDGYAGVIFERIGEPIDISRFGKVTMEINISGEPREAEHIETKFEGTFRRYGILLNVEQLRGKGWNEVTLPFEKQNLPRRRRLQRVVLADNGRLATLGSEYKIGLRKIKFE